MSKFLDVTLPKALIEAQEKRKSLEYDRWELNKRLDYDDEWSDHDCDCEYCESNNSDVKPISFVERNEIEDKVSSINKELDLLSLDIKRMSSYKAFMTKQRIN